MSRYKFCPECDNNFSNYSSYIERINGKLVNKLKYYCSGCGYEQEEDKISNPQEAILFRKNNLNKKPDREINPDMCYDSSLSRTTIGNCPNKDCESNKKNFSSEKLMFSRNQEDSLGFICCACQSSWNSS